MKDLDPIRASKHSRSHTRRPLQFGLRSFCAQHSPIPEADWSDLRARLAAAAPPDVWFDLMHFGAIEQDLAKDELVAALLVTLSGGATVGPVFDRLETMPRRIDTRALAPSMLPEAVSSMLAARGPSAYAACVETALLIARGAKRDAVLIDWHSDIWLRGILVYGASTLRTFAVAGPG